MEITSADALFPADGGGATLDGLGPRGNVIGRIDADTGCGHVVGSFMVPYCSWFTCVLN